MDGIEASVDSAEAEVSVVTRATAVTMLPATTSNCAVSMTSGQYRVRMIILNFLTLTACVMPRLLHTKSATRMEARGTFSLFESSYSKHDIKESFFHFLTAISMNYQ